MDLWIRSQDRRDLLPANNRIRHNGTSIIIFDRSEVLTLGYYAIEERTLEVLDEIQRYILKEPIFDKYECRECSKNVYEMPKE